MQAKYFWFGFHQFHEIFKYISLTLSRTVSHGGRTGPFQVFCSPASQSSFEVATGSVTCAVDFAVDDFVFADSVWRSVGNVAEHSVAIVVVVVVVAAAAALCFFCFSNPPS